MDGPPIVKARVRAPRTFDTVIPCTSMLFGNYETWPAHMQDKMYEAMERLMEQTGVRELRVNNSYVKAVGGGLYQAYVECVEVIRPEDVIISHHHATEQ